MKRILKWTAVFALGLAVGCGVTGFAVDKFYRGQMAQMYSWSVGSDALLAQTLREGNAQILLESADRRLVEGILELTRNEALKDLTGTGTSLQAAKRYYVCTKTEYPPEIASIMNDLTLLPQFQCNGDE
jgi:hypothetical protein